MPVIIPAPEQEERIYIPGVVPPKPLLYRLTPYLAEIDSSLFNEEPPPFFVIAAAAGEHMSECSFRGKCVSL
jgi:hypothetical protein